MKKEIFLRQFPQELEYEASKLYNTFEIAKKYEIISFTEEFYTPNFWKKLTEKFDGIKVITDGIFEDSDRRQIGFVPDGFDIDEGNTEFPCRLLEIEINSKFREYEHKDFLGSLMGLNIKRELMGDLILEDDRGYIPVSEKIYGHILSELKQVGKAPCKVKEISLSDIENLPKYKFDDKIITVPSKRLDSIVSAITNLSRTKVIEPIERGKVLIDYFPEKDKSKILELDTVITIRGYGKYRLFSDRGETKKGKERILIKKYGTVSK